LVLVLLGFNWGELVFGLGLVILGFVVKIRLIDIGGDSGFIGWSDLNSQI
jgi:hypothetical protein